MQYNFLTKPIGKTFFFLSVASFIVAFDQFLKYKIRQDNGLFLCNRGISFGIQLSGIVFWLIIGIFSFIVLFFCVFLYKKRSVSRFSVSALLGLALFTGGVLSNLLDRFLVGCVLDYISFFKSFPVFNLADVSIFLGSCFVLFFLLSKNRSFGE